MVSKIVLLTGLLAGLTSAAPSTLPLSLLPRAPPPALPQRATSNDLRWQPSMDFDTDGCYNVAAVSASGAIVPGLPHSWVGLSSDCRDASDLSSAYNNVYSRQRCNGEWCVYLYGYYFEKDVAIAYFADPGHTHDWEHIAVWVRNGAAEYVAVSQHGDYEIRRASEIRWDGQHPKVVYHKDGVSTHCFRFANADDDNIENHTGQWFRGPLVSYNGFPGNVRDTLFAYDFGAATIAIKDSTFADNVGRARPSGITFDNNLDVNSPGNP
ncbi:hypothetical protein S7711_09052 [Stachybotrys chartarum IBT 7711]|uniref:Uncharacterized protein n=1 Tax=Stachybotrys chartarum (strain CBS 109288 / IBT 7711) TaxID=1280523 RepID=A0A084APM8_STACB|nr:hypothetical protein S7711_09052 [Stachybotrys chartarum IBT 7711]KFA47615.1 hypothetical protein S40293_09190 [Stachybotrys chartarum IBT 40293]